MPEAMRTVVASPFGLAMVAGWVAVLGAAVASFVCVAAERLPRGLSVNGRSRCVCGRQLSEVENVPVLSWLVLRGRSRCCRSAIPVFYLVAELTLAVVWGSAAAVLGLPGTVAVALVSAFALLVWGMRRLGR